jgi:hypothetical protein
VLPGVLAVALLFLAMGGYLFYSMVLAPRAPGERDLSTFGLFCGLVPILLAGFLAWKVTSQHGPTVRVSADGLIYRHAGKDLEFPWEQIVSVRTAATAYTINFAPVGTFTTMTLERDDGAEAVLVSDLRNAEELFDTILKETLAHLLPLMRERFRNGEKVSFGPLALSKDGIHVGSDKLPWTQCSGISASGGKLILNAKGSLLGVWKKLPMSAISNYHVMVSLIAVERLRP